MARPASPPSFLTQLKYYFLFFLTLTSLYLAPILIEAYYPPLKPLGDACQWLTDAFDHGFFALCTVMAVTMLSMLVNDARLFLARVFTRRTATGPVALEDGVAVPPSPLPAAAPDAAATEDPATPAPAVQVKATIHGKIFSLLSTTYFAYRQIAREHLVALDRPVLENVGGVALYLLRGFEVLFALFLGLMFVGWMKGRRAAAAAEGDAAAAPVATEVEVLFDEAEKVDEKAEVKT
ncbi:hypothetical protein R3P38DRAFT_3026722 [Favolaschia claudopus]|uniref:Uncharacterized protein n=1 Tax=Favolaschia claudopus TaxID=2862362 RepID=A0AAW0AGF9_9AGAR